MKSREPFSTSSLFLPSITVVPPIVALIGATIDGQRKIRDSQGYLTWTSSSDYSEDISKYFYALLVGVAILVLIKDALQQQELLSLPLTLVLWPIALLTGQILRVDLSGAITTAASSIVLLAILISRSTDGDYKLVARIIVLIAAAASIYAVLQPERALIECRADKCTAWGVLVTSFMPQENVLALFALGGLTIVLYALSGLERALSVMLVLAILLSTGSRGAIIAGAGVLAVHFYGFVYRRWNGRSAMLLKLISLVPLIFTAASGAVFFAPGLFGSLTGRDFIMRLLHTYWVQSPFIGPGREVLTEAFNSGNSANYLISHEHGQVPYVLISGGIIGTICFSIWLIAMVNQTRVFGKEQIALMGVLIGMSIVFLTEPVWQFDVRASTFWSLAFASALYLRIKRTLSHPNKFHLTHRSVRNLRGKKK